jgi:hypothetical protein
MRTTSSRKGIPVAQTICVIVCLSPLVLVRLWSTREIDRIKASQIVVSDTQTAIRTWCRDVDCSAYPAVDNPSALATAIGAPYNKLVAPVDGWGRALHVVCRGEGYVVASAGADGQLEPDVAALLSPNLSGSELFAATKAFAAAARARTYAARAARTPWYRERNNDLVSGLGEILSNNQLLDAPSAPPEVIRRYALTISLPAALAFIALTIFGRRRR